MKKNNAKSRTKALIGNFKRCTVKDIHPHIKFIMTDENVHVWYFMMGAMVDLDNVGEFSGNEYEFLKGQFFGKITATQSYPFSPPNVEMLTPTGVFPLNNNDFCIDIGKYHKGNYPPTLGMDGYTKMIWSGLVGWRDLGHGINLISGNKKDRVNSISKASFDSQKYNRDYNSHIVEMFRDISNSFKPSCDILKIKDLDQELNTLTISDQKIKKNATKKIIKN